MPVPTVQAGVLLVVGAVLFLVGAGIPPEPRRVFGAPLPEHLAILRLHSRRWQLMNGLMIVGVVATMLGLVVAARALTLTGDASRSVIGAGAYAFGAVLWVVVLAFRGTVTVAVAREFAGDCPPPSWLAAMHDWTRVLFWLYMALGYFAIAMFGWAIVHTGLPAAWLGRSGVVFGYLLGILFVIGRPKVGGVPLAEPPFLLHLPTLTFGIGFIAA